MVRALLPCCHRWLAFFVATIEGARRRGEPMGVHWQATSRVNLNGRLHCGCGTAPATSCTVYVQQLSARRVARDDFVQTPATVHDDSETHTNLKKKLERPSPLLRSLRLGRPRQFSASRPPTSARVPWGTALGRRRARSDDGTSCVLFQDRHPFALQDGFCGFRGVPPGMYRGPVAPPLKTKPLFDD